MRHDGYLPIEAYALIGDGRTAALVGTDGAIDWLCLPNFDSPSLIGALLDAERGGSTSTLVLVSAYAEPLILPSRSEVERRMTGTIGFWKQWTTDRGYSGPWPEAVLRSALVLKALIFAPTGAPVAAPTTSLPESIGGERNWDYRYCWIRDSNFAIDALLNLGCYPEA